MLSASVLAALAAAGASGCSSARPWPWATPPRPSPDVGLLRDAIAAEQGMISRYTSVISAFPALTGTISPLLAQHRAHLSQLRGRLVIPRGASPSQSASATARPRGPRPQVPSSQPAAVGYLAAAERGEAAALVGWLATVTPSLAQLMASVGACEAVHSAVLNPAWLSAALLTPAGRPAATGPGGPAADAAAVGALQDVLAAQNAAIYGYGVAGAYLDGARQGIATACWNDHRVAADTLAGLLRARGVQPVAADDAYKMPFTVGDAHQAVLLAAFLEDGVTTACLSLVAAGPAGLRQFGAGMMQDCAVRAAFWRGSAPAFPGLPASAVRTHLRRARARRGSTPAAHSRGASTLAIRVAAESRSSLSPIRSAQDHQNHHVPSWPRPA